MDNNVKAINQISALTKLQEVQVFLGMMGHYWRFIKYFDQISEPLIHLLRGVPFEWGPFNRIS